MAVRAVLALDAEADRRPLTTTVRNVRVAGWRHGALCHDERSSGCGGRLGTRSCDGSPVDGHVFERPWSDGQTVSYGAQVRAYGGSEKVTFGTNTRGWNRTRAGRSRTRRSTR